MATTKDNPIGIFDSGVGGLTVAAAISRILPNEHLLYFGDTAHTPWGSQSKAAIAHYATKITEALLDHNCKAIVIACNTASATVLHDVQSAVGDRALVFNVIDPVVEYLAAHFAYHKVGLIGTKQTIKSKAYATKLHKSCPSINLQSLATPLLVPIIEEGLSHTPAALEFIRHYLKQDELLDITALILGCTHYPLIKQQVQELYNHQVTVIDSAELMAQRVAVELAAKDLLNDAVQPRKMFYVSHDSSFFSATAKQFFPEEIHLQTYALWEQVSAVP